jgi:SOS response regulatory protein OraA/RecX
LEYAERVKLHRSLMNRGFTHEQASVALDRIRQQYQDQTI